MPRSTAGSIFKTKDGYGIRWPEDGKRPQRTGFATKTEAEDELRRELEADWEAFQAQAAAA